MLIPPSHASPEVGLQTCTCISLLSGPVELTLPYTTPDIHCRQRGHHECDGRIIGPTSTAVHITVRSRAGRVDVELSRPSSALADLRRCRLTHWSLHIRQVALLSDKPNSHFPRQRLHRHTATLSQFAKFGVCEFHTYM